VVLSPRLTRHLSVVYPNERFHSRLVNSFVKRAKEPSRRAANRGQDPTHGQSRTIVATHNARSRPASLAAQHELGPAGISPLERAMS
jgi:hypothetical protein